MDELTEALVVAARAGSREAWAGLYVLLAPRVQGYLTARGSTDPEAMTQEVFVQVLPRVENLDGGPSALRSFVFSVAHARLVDERRRGAARPVAVEYDPRHDLRSTRSAEHDVLVRRLSPDLERALERLTEDQREVLFLRVVAGLSIEECAGALARTTGAIKQLHRRALLALRGQVSSPTRQEST